MSYKNPKMMFIRYTTLRFYLNTLDFDEKFSAHAYVYKRGDELFRKYVDIKRKQMPEEQSIPDVMIVMMNPGYNNPKNPQDEFQEGIIEIIPDITLKAIISLMEDDQVQQKYTMNWCRIINLSDYEHPNIDKFIQKFDYYCDIYDDTHSLFSDERKQEFDEIFLVSPSSIVILAWGNNPQMADLRTKAYETVQDKVKQYNNKVFGWFFQPDEKHQKLCWRYSYQRAFKQYNYQAQKQKEEMENRIKKYNQELTEEQKKEMWEEKIRKSALLPTSSDSSSENNSKTIVNDNNIANISNNEDGKIQDNTSSQIDLEAQTQKIGQGQNDDQKQKGKEKDIQKEKVKNSTKQDKIKKEGLLIQKKFDPKNPVKLYGYHHPLCTLEIKKKPYFAWKWKIASQMIDDYVDMNPNPDENSDDINEMLNKPTIKQEKLKKQQERQQKNQSKEKNGKISKPKSKKKESKEENKIEDEFDGPEDDDFEEEEEKNKPKKKRINRLITQCQNLQEINISKRKLKQREKEQEVNKAQDKVIKKKQTTLNFSVVKKSNKEESKHETSEQELNKKKEQNDVKKSIEENNSVIQQENSQQAQQNEKQQKELQQDQIQEKQAQLAQENQKIQEKLQQDVLNNSINEKKTIKKPIAKNKGKGKQRGKKKK